MKGDLDIHERNDLYEYLASDQFLEWFSRKSRLRRFRLEKSGNDGKSKTSRVKKIVMARKEVQRSRDHKKDLSINCLSFISFLETQFGSKVGIEQITKEMPRKKERVGGNRRSTKLSQTEDTKIPKFPFPGIICKISC
jgi:hypothetical protein